MQIDMSFSQCNQYLLCGRSWAFSKVDGLPGLPSLAAVRGNRYHEAIEKEIVSGPVISGANHEYVNRAVKIVHGFDEFEAEAFLETTVDGVHVRGYADVIGSNFIDVSGSLDSDTYTGFDREVQTVIDWKFPGKHPGKTPKKDYVDQLQLYGLLAGADKLMVVYPEHDVAFSFDADEAHGQRVLDRLVEVGRDILETRAYEKSGMETEPTMNWTCAEYCSFRHLCPLGAN